MRIKGTNNLEFSRQSCSEKYSGTVTTRLKKQVKWLKKKLRNIWDFIDLIFFFSANENRFYCFCGLRLRVLWHWSSPPFAIYTKINKYKNIYKTYTTNYAKIILIALHVKIKIVITTVFFLCTPYYLIFEGVKCTFSKCGLEAEIMEQLMRIEFAIQS